MTRPGRTALCVSERCCVTVGEYHDIKQYHSGLCALTQGALCTFLPGWGDQGESEWEVVVVGGGGTVCWHLTVCTDIAVLQLLCSLGKVMENIMGNQHMKTKGRYSLI